MRIVDRKTFLELPEGTVFAKYDPCIIREPMVKCDSTPNAGELVDFYYANLTDEVDCSGSCARDGIMDLAVIEGLPFALDFNSQCRDGMYDADQLFAVWERDDVAGLISRLQTALVDGYPSTVLLPKINCSDERPISNEVEPVPIVKNIKAPSDLAVGDYVFASRWSDCSPGDP